MREESRCNRAHVTVADGCDDVVSRDWGIVASDVGGTGTSGVR